jgi:radical SAM superfamily enzyme YgiQ (UPF0313 family)
MADILLATINAKWIHPSLALRLLKANLASLEERAEIAEFALRQPLPEKVVPILRARPRILAVSVSIWNHQATVELLAALNEAWEQEEAGKPVIVMGGPEVSWLDEDAAILRYADWVVRGEGELVFRQLCELLLENETPSGPERREHCRAEIMSKLKGCYGIKSVGGKFIEAGPVDPAAIKSAYRLYTKEDLEKKLVYVEASRGCPFGCEFCLSSLDRRVREFPLETFLAEMDGLLESGARRFKFLDRTFNLDAERTGKVLEFFLEKTRSLQTRTPDTEAPSPAAREPVCVHFEMVPSRLPAELRGLLARFEPGTLRLELGIQTFNPRTAALVGRAGDPEKELETLEFLCRCTSAIVHADLIAGLPSEDLASFAAGFDRLWQALSVRNAVPSGAAITTTVTAAPAAGEKPRTEIQLGILKRLPGTPIARHDKAFGMRYAADPPYEVRETAALSADDLNRIRNFARFWELIVNRGSYPDFTARFLPPGKPAFNRFMELADTLLARFGRNWGIDRKELKAVLDSQQ